MNKYLLFLYFLLSFNISGCAQNNVKNASLYMFKNGAPDNTGLVIAETLNNSERITGPIYRWSQITIVPASLTDPMAEDAVIYAVTPLGFNISTQRYSGALPEGEYRILSLNATVIIGDRTYTASLPVFKEFGTFNVKAGQLTDLGTVLYQPFENKSRVDRDYPDYALTRVQNDRLWNDIKSYANPVIANYQQQSPDLKWNKDKFENHRREAADLINESALPTKVHRLKNGRILAHGHNGTFYYQDGSSYKKIKLNHNYEILDFSELSESQWLFASEFGILNLFNKVDGTVETINIDHGANHIRDIALSFNNQPYIISTTIKNYKVYKLHLDSKKTSLLKTFKRRYLGRAHYPLKYPTTLSTDDGIAIFVNNFVYRYNEVKNSWSDAPSSEYHYILQQGNGMALRAGFDVVESKLPVKYSLDQGVNWRKTNIKLGSHTGEAYRPIYRLMNGEIIRIGKDVLHKIFYGVYALEEIPVNLQKLNSSAWLEIGTVPSSCLEIQTEPSTDNNLIVLCENGSIVNSTDNGRSWKVIMEKTLPHLDDFPAEFTYEYKEENKK